MAVAYAVCAAVGTPVERESVEESWGVVETTMTVRTNARPVGSSAAACVSMYTKYKYTDRNNGLLGNGRAWGQLIRAAGGIGFAIVALRSLKPAASSWPQKKSR